MAIYRKNIENKASSELHPKLEDVLTASAIGSWCFNTDTRVIYRYPRVFDKILGSKNPFDKLTFAQFINHVHKEDRELVRLKFEIAITNKTFFSLHCRVNLPDGILRWVHIRGKFFRFNESPYLLGVIEDITDSKALDEELRLTEEHLRLLINTTQDYAICMLDPEGLITSWNEAAAHMFGYSENEIIGKHFSIFFTDPSAKNHTFQFELQKACSQGRYEEKNWRIRKDNSRFWGNMILTPLYNIERELIGFTKIDNDLTQQESIKQQLDTLLELRQTNQELEQFACEASHDLKAPLRSMQSIIEWIETDDSSKLSEEAKENFALLASCAKRLSNLIDDILAYSRAGNVEEEMTSVSIKDLLQEIVESLTPPSHIKIHIPENLTTIHAHRFQLQQVLCNLISNAIKYNDKSEGQINISMKDKGKYYEFTVEDNGPGIDPKFHNKIFEIFQTLQSKSESESTGVGLSIVKKFVENEGGHVSVKSQLGKGASFIFSWPKAKSDLL